MIGFGDRLWLLGPEPRPEFLGRSGARLVSVCDLKERLAGVPDRYPAVETTSDLDAVLRIPAGRRGRDRDPGVESLRPRDARPLGGQARVWSKSRMTATAEQALRLVEEAERRRRAVTWSTTRSSTPERWQDPRAGGGRQHRRVYYYDSVRVNLGLFQHDVNVLWDLAVHDLAIMDYILTHGRSRFRRWRGSHAPASPRTSRYLICFSRTT